MKKLILLALIAAGAWWHFVGGRKLSEDNVKAFYRDYEIATLQRKPDALCALLADDLQASGSAAVGRRVVQESKGKAETCDDWHALFDSWVKLGEKMGGILQLDSHYEIHSIEFSPDRKSAKVDISSTLDVAGSIMNFSTRSTQTLIRRNGKVLLQRSDSRGSVSAGG